MVMIDEEGPPNQFLDTSFNFYYPHDAKQTDEASPEVLAMTHVYWTTFAPVHPIVQHIFGLIFFLLWMISTVGNVTVVFLFIKVKTLRTPSNMFVVALALSDLLMITSNAPPLFINCFMGRYWAFGLKACEWYAFLGGVSGLWSLWLIILIGYDRHNTIVKGLSGTKISSLRAQLLILLALAYSVGVCVVPLTKVWGKYALEGMLLTCSFDYITDTTSNKTFTACFFFACYCLPFGFVLYFYSSIVGAVVAHERNLRQQAKKMNVESLRSNENKAGDSAEVRIAKVALTNVCVWLVAWTPYAAVAMLGQFGSSFFLLTPIITQFPSFLAKTASCFNPIIYASSHPKFREAMANECPCMGIGEKAKADDTKTQTTRA